MLLYTPATNKCQLGECYQGAVTFSDNTTFFLWKKYFNCNIISFKESINRIRTLIHEITKFKIWREVKLWNWIQINDIAVVEVTGWSNVQLIHLGKVYRVISRII